MTVHRLERELVVPAPLREVAAFFERPENLGLITPPWMAFELATAGPVEMSAGARIDYRLRVAGVRLRWRTVIARWEPGVRFVDEQERGPYRLWRHLHEFSPVPGGTRVRDRVDYEVGWWLLGELAHALYVRRTLARIFEFRAVAVEARFGRSALAPAGGLTRSSSRRGAGARATDPGRGRHAAVD